MVGLPSCLEWLVAMVVLSMYLSENRDVVVKVNTEGGLHTAGICLPVGLPISLTTMEVGFCFS